MNWELNKSYFGCNHKNVDYEFKLINENDTQYLIEFRRVGTEHWNTMQKDKTLIHTRGIERYKAKYSKLGKALT
jgi:hypothetical protein